MARRRKDRNEFWLVHLRRCAKSRRTAKQYAAQHDLSAEALYMARSRLKQQGLWPERSPVPAGFAKLEVIEKPVARSGRFSVELQSGVRMHWEQAPELEQIVGLASALSVPS